MPPHRKHGWPFWITAAVVALPLLYVASFGPACWISDNYEWPRREAAIIFRPLIAATFDGPAPVRRGLRTYARWFAPPNPVFPLIDPIDELSEDELRAIYEFMVHGIIEELREIE